MRGVMLWFNEVKDLGMILTEEGERLAVDGSEFADGKRPEGRCAKSVVSYEVRGARDERSARQVVFVAPEPQRRARPRHSSTRVRF